MQRVLWNPRRKNSPGWDVDPVAGCHLWWGARTSQGYGTVTSGGRRSLSVTRLRYEREVGPIPPAMVLDHYLCNNPRCCNPLHVRPVSRREDRLRGKGLDSWQPR